MKRRRSNVPHLCSIVLDYLSTGRQPPEKMNKVIVASVLVLLGTIGFSAYAYTVYIPSLSNSGLGGPNSGTLSIYLTDPPPTAHSLKYLLVNVTGVTLKYSSNLTETTSTSTSASTTSTLSSVSSTSSTSASSTSSDPSTSSTADSRNSFQNRFSYAVAADVGTNVNLTSLHGNGVLLGKTSAPAGNVTGIILNVTGARAYWTDGNSTQLKVVADGKLMINAHFTIQPDGSTSLTISISTGSIHISPGQASVLRPVVQVTAVSSGSSGTQSTETTETASDISSSTST